MFQFVFCCWSWFLVFYWATRSQCVAWIFHPWSPQLWVHDQSGYFSLFVVEDPSIWIVNLSFANFRFLIQSILISPSPLCHVLIAHMFSPHTPSPVRCHFTSHLQPYPTPHPLPILHPICQISNVLFQLTFKNELSVSHFESVRYIRNKLKQWDSPKKGQHL